MTLMLATGGSDPDKTFGRIDCQIVGSLPLPPDLLCFARWLSLRWWLGNAWEWIPWAER